MNLVKILQDQVGPTLVHKASSTLGMDSDQVSGAVSKLLPSVVGLLGKKAATPEGASGLFKSLTQGTAADLFNNDDVDALTQGLSKVSDLPAEKAESLLKLGTPVIASKMKWLIESEKLSTDGFSKIMTAQSDHLKDFDLDGVLGKVGLGGAVAGAAGVASSLKDKATDAVSDTVDSAKAVVDKTPEDSVLARHHEQAKDAASNTTSSVTDGVTKAAAAGTAAVAGVGAAAGALKDKASDAVSDTVDSAKNLGDKVPEDSVLRRHHEQAKFAAENASDVVSDTADSATSGVSKTAVAAGTAATAVAGSAAASVSDATTGAATPEVPAKAGLGWGKILGWLAVIAAIIWGLFTCQKSSTPEVVTEAEETVVTEAAEEVTEIAEEATEVVEEAAEEVVEEAAEVVEEAAEEVVEEAAGVVEEAAEEVVEETAEVAEETTEEVTEAVEETVEEATEVVTEEAAEAVTEEASEVTEAAEETTETVVEEAKETMSEATEAATSNFGAAKNAVETASSDFGAAAAVTETAETAIAAVREVTLPGGTSISLSEGSPVDQIITFLQDDSAELPQSFILRGLTFQTSSAQITDESANIVDDLGATLKAYNNVKISLEGHTDSRGVAEANLALSEARAESVLNTLTTKGVARDRMTATGHGPAAAIADNETAEGRQENRRVEVIITER